jgi:hypothetical protein
MMGTSVVYGLYALWNISVVAWYLVDPGLCHWKLHGRAIELWAI